MGGSKRTLTKLAGSLRQGQTYHLRIVKEGYDIYCYLDNTLYHHITLPASRGVYACASLNQAEDSLILKLVNLGETQEAILRFKDFRWTGQIEQQVLTSNSGSDENSMTALNKVKPVESVPSQCVIAEFACSNIPSAESSVRALINSAALYPVFI